MSDLGLGYYGDTGDDEHHQVNRVDPCQAQPPKVNRLATGQFWSQLVEIGVREDEAGQGEEQVYAETTDAHSVVEDRDGQQAQGGQRYLEVVKHNPRRCDKANTGQLPDEHVHLGILAPLSRGHRLAR